MILSLIGSIVHFLVNAYILVLFIRMILDWVAVLASAWRPRGLVSSLIDAVYQLTGAPTALATPIYPPYSIGSHLLRCGIHRSLFHSHCY